MGQYKPTANIGPTWPHKGPRNAQQVRKMDPTGPNIPQHTPDSDPILPKISDIDVYLLAKIITSKFLKAIKNMQNSIKNACFFGTIYTSNWVYYTNILEYFIDILQTI